MYVKLYDTMFNGTLAKQGPWQAVVTFQQLLILAEPDGTVDMTPEAIARRTTIPLEIITIGLAALEQPDPESRSPECDGRRIVRLSESRSWGWRLVNYASYRAMRDETDRREYQKAWARDARARKKANGASTNVDSVDTASTVVDNIDQGRPKSTQAVSSKQKKNKHLVRSNGMIAPAQLDSFAEFWSLYPRKLAKQTAVRAWQALDPDTALQAKLLDAVRVQTHSQSWQQDLQREGGKHIPHPATWLNQRRWEDELLAPAPSGRDEPREWL